MRSTACGYSLRGKPPFHQPLSEIARLPVEIETDADDLLPVRLERDDAAFAGNPRQGFLRRAVQLELHHVAVLLRLQQQVDAARARVVFRLYVEAHQLEQQVSQVAEQLVGRVREEAAALNARRRVSESDVIGMVMF